MTRNLPASAAAMNGAWAEAQTPDRFRSSLDRVSGFIDSRDASSTSLIRYGAPAGVAAGARSGARI